MNTEVKTIKDVEKLLEVLTPDQRQLLKDTIRYGAWGDTDYEFIENGKIVTRGSMGYCTNDAKDGGHFGGRKISAMFRSMYSRLGLINGNGTVISHASDWWGDGTGDILFVRDEWCEAFESWSRITNN